MILRALFPFLLFAVPVGVLIALVRRSRTAWEQLAAVGGMLVGGVGTFFVLLKLIPYGDGGGPIFSFLGALLLGAPLGGGFAWWFTRHFRVR